MKRFALLLGVLLALGVFVSQAGADPGPGDEVVFTAGDCQGNPTVLSAHNTQDKLLHYLMRVDGRIVAQGALPVGERVSKSFTQPNASEHFYRIRLGLNIDHVYFSDEGWTRLHCEPTPPPPTTTPPPPPTTTPPPPTTTPPPSTTTTPPPPSTTTTPPPPTTTPPRPCKNPPCETAHTGGVPWWSVAGFAVLLGLATLALIVGRKRTEEV